ncbi:hypothetical protein ABT168_09990 [Streptomyces sp. NPDC001793]|uniref:hypothetical protein n=1 Tax=Streptomyces sp. NPDC001793 TaxID=3154657 RepID=UPI003327DD42
MPYNQLLFIFRTQLAKEPPPARMVAEHAAVQHIEPLARAKARGVMRAAPPPPPPPKITNDLDNHANPVEVSANARHHSPGYTMARYGRRRAEGAKKPAASNASRLGLSSLA